ncbi:nicotinate (nicotinamide) nucleotide adenylyltransferase [uncultured Muribaculum sp.]|uniref:nicotinate (nicotinamide) nucleotide adenylyltransferase n=1 Tax=uncultured Muribaculum sp. TaxID=1918613 RepID=UPI0025E9BE18|nr:nicotinate (nicotinamide) nucleotide adenylyltransferase [uncultured Muribaculum sp.]
MSVTRKRIGIMGGSFNPVHTGHMIVASYIAQWSALDEVWLVLSPQNPFKKDMALTPDADRLAMLRIAVAGSTCLRACDVELSMPRPSYTIDTLRHLSAMYPDYDFTLIIGSDNWESFSRWRSPAEIISEYGLVVYPRPGHPVAGCDSEAGVVCVDAPQVELSSTFIRRAIAEGRDMNFFLPSGVYQYIQAHGLYGAER